MKKFLSVILSLVVLITAVLSVNIISFADSSLKCGANITAYYNSAKGTLTLSGSGKMDDYATWKDAPWREGAKYNITELIIGEGITSIGSWAFSNIANLQRVTMPSTLTNIGDRAFSGCYSVTEFNIPASVNSIGANAFMTASASLPSKLKAIYVDDNNKNYCDIDGVFYDKACKNLYIVPSLTALETLDIPSTVTTIGELAAVNCRNVKTIIVSESVNVIGSQAFYECKNLNLVIFKHSNGPFTVGTELVTANDALVFMGYKSNTILQRYAEENGIAFEAIDAECQHDGEQILINRCSADCTNSGYTGDRLCSLCGEVVEYGSEIPAAGHKIVTEKAVTATCTKTGKTQGSYCSVCQTVITAQKTVAKTAHSYKTTTKTTKATKSANGKVVTTYTCKTCGYTYSKTTKTIYKPTTYTLSTSTYTYNGSAKKPSVTIKDSKGNKLKSGTDYTVTYPSGRKNVGKYTIKITFKGNYSGTATKSFTINPKNTSLSSVSAGSKKFTVKWKKYTIQTTGYQIQYSTDKNFKKNNKTVTVSSNKTTSKTISKLSGKKKYYVRIRTYKTVSGTKYYSSWSSAKTVTTKK
ncbi:MAG: fibronectin type III domain-containing protein [Clostridium sp.]|nr:fibronectin type III domain-containing protein [Clostridium sp.]